MKITKVCFNSRINNIWTRIPVFQSKSELAKFFDKNEFLPGEFYAFREEKQTRFFDVYLHELRIATQFTPQPKPELFK